MSTFKPYRPANGSEGRLFERQFCERCVHDEGCEIIYKALLHGVHEPEYPGDTWVYFNGTPTCLAFRERGGEEGDAPAPTGPNQGDLFYSPQITEEA